MKENMGNFIKTLSVTHAIAKYMVVALFVSSITACGSIMPSSDVGVSVSGVNYSEREIDGYAFFNPDNPKEIAGGEGLDPYSGGGIMCCYSLPKTWRPGIKVGLIVDNINGDGKRTKVILEVPPYPDDAVGDLWAIVYPDGTLGAVSTNFGPANEKWPGKIKGWPKPSVEYRRKIWERGLENKQLDVKNAKQLLQELKINPEKRLQDSWVHKSKYEKEQIKQFLGPNDPNYKNFLLNDYEEYLRESQKDVDDWLRRKP